jgi:hypothetical protein
LSVLTTNLEKGGYTMVTPFTQTTANRQTIYVATATKEGDTFALTYYPASSSSDASGMQQQQINKYIGLGYAQSPDSTSSEWIGVLSSNQGVGVQLLDFNPVDGVLVIRGASPSPIPVSTPSATPSNAPLPTVTPQPSYQVTISGPSVLQEGQGGAWVATVYKNGVPIPQEQLIGKIYWFIDGKYHQTNTMMGDLVNSATMRSDSNGEETTWAPAGAHILNAEYMGDPSYPNTSITVVSMGPPPLPSPTPFPTATPTPIPTIIR